MSSFEVENVLNKFDFFCVIPFSQFHVIKTVEHHIVNGENCATQSSIERSDQLVSKRDSAVQRLKINQKRMKFVFW